MKDIISRAKYADPAGNPVGLTRAYHCTNRLHYDMVW